MGSEAREDLSGRTAMQLFHVILSRCSLSFTLDANASAAPPPSRPSSACKGYPSSIHADFPLPLEGRTGNPPPCTVWQPDMCAYPSSASLPFLLLDPLLFVRRLHVVRGVYYLTLTRTCSAFPFTSLWIPLWCRINCTTATRHADLLS